VTSDHPQWRGEVADGGDPHPTLSRTPRFAGSVWDVVTDEVDFDGTVIRRDILVHPGAVAIIALDAAERVLLIRQYRHAVGRYLFEPPAGLLDAAGEDPLATARRELLEEAGVEAEDWAVLLDLLNSPGGSSEAIRIYLARGLRMVPRPFTGEAEEADLPQAWVPLDDARDGVLAGRITSPHGVAGILAAEVARAGDWTALRPADAPWPMRAHLLEIDRVREPRA
jgi:ADP-ribose pyrophosphatase